MKVFECEWRGLFEIREMTREIRAKGAKTRREKWWEKERGVLETMSETGEEKRRIVVERMRLVSGRKKWGGRFLKGGREGDVFETTCSLRHDSDKVTSLQPWLGDVQHCHAQSLSLSLFLPLSLCLLVHLFVEKPVQITAIKVKRTFYRNADIISHVVVAAARKIQVWHYRKKSSFDWCLSFFCCLFSVVIDDIKVMSFYITISFSCLHPAPHGCCFWPCWALFLFTDLLIGTLTASDSSPSDKRVCTQTKK